MSRIENAKVLQNGQIAPDIYDLRIHQPEQAVQAVAGQFLGIYTGDAAMLLPRPLSICEIDADKGVLRVIYRVVGDGTREIAKAVPGDTLRVLGPLGNGYEGILTANDASKTLIVGGGLGVPPMLGLAARIREARPDGHIAVYLGFRDKSQVILEDDFKKYADKVIVCTDDGSYGAKGHAVGVLPQEADIIYGCGPAPMLKALSQYATTHNIPCFVSVEEHMACCVGTCLACAVKVSENGNAVNKRACHDGPVFNAKEVVWE